MASLAAGLEEDLAKRGFVREKRPYRAHLTLGRCRSARGQGQLLAALASRREAYLGEMKVDHFHLMRSELTPQGAIYTVLDRFEMRT